ncbi:MAG TPA: hypothetical protein VJ727_07920 [Rhodanobacteraceae bacterium]|nr:hypothetical protein [Rhodanobacteraceae bacterium]
MRFLAILLLAPWLAVLGWLYWLYVRRVHGAHTRARFDTMLLIAAFVAAIECADFTYELETGIAGAIWKQVAAALACYAGFSTVLLIGLLRHAWLRRRRDARTSDERHA